MLIRKSVVIWGIKMNLYEEFVYIVSHVNKELDITPVLYGSLGLEKATGIDFQPQDIDMLVPLVFLEGKWDLLKGAMESLDYKLVDIHEHEFMKNEIKVGIAFIEDLKPFANIDYNHLKTIEDNGAIYHMLSISDYLKVYQKSSLDGYRRTKNNHKDQEKVQILQQLISQNN